MKKLIFLLLCSFTSITCAIAAPVVEKVAISGDKLIVTGHKFLDIDGLFLLDPKTGFKKPFKVQSATESKIVGRAVDLKKITVASLMNLIIDTAKGESIYPVYFFLQKDAVTNRSIRDGAITPRKFYGVSTSNPPDQSVLTWSEPTQSFLFKKVSGKGGSSGVSQIVLGAGITGAPNTASGSVPISVDIGQTGDTSKPKIPYFNSSNKIVLDSTSSPSGLLSGLSFKDGNLNFDISNDNGLRIDSGVASDLLVLGVDGSLSLKGPVTVGGLDVCLSNGNCSSSGTSGLTNVTATAPLVATKSASTINISPGAVNTANNLVKLDSTGKFPSTIPGVVRGPGAVTGASVPFFSNTNGNYLGNSGILYQNLATITEVPTAANKVVISTGANKVLGSTSYTIPSTSGVTGQVLGLTATGTADWINVSSGGGVTSFKTRIGAVVPVAGDYTATLVTSTAGGSVSATTVQAAIQELDTEKLPKAGGTMTGTITTSTQNALKIGPAGSLTGEIQFLETAANGTSYVAFKSPASLATNTVWTLPAADGTFGQVLSTNGSKVLSWTSAGVSGAGNVVGPNSSENSHLATFDGITGRLLADSGISSKNVAIMSAVPGTANQMIISTGNANNLGSTSYTIPSTSGVTGQVLGLTATGTADWINVSSGGGVTSFKTRIGAVVPVAGDYTATLVTSTATGSVAATTIQAAIAELDTEKLPKAGGTMTGTITTSTQNALKIGPAGSLTGEIQFLETAANGTSYVAFKSPASLATNTVWTLPAADGTSGQVLSTNGSKVLSWTSAGAGGAGNVVGPASSKATNLATFSGTTGKAIQDSSISSNDLVTMGGAGSVIAGNVVVTIGGKVVQDSTINLANIPTMPANATLANQPILGVAGQKVQVAAPYTLPNKNCSAGQILKWDVAVTGFTCQADLGGLTSVQGDTSPLPLATLDTTIPIYSGEDGQTIKHSFWKLNGIQLEGPTAFIGENSTFKGMNVGCFSNMLFNSSSSYGFCQDTTGDASLGTTNKVDFKVGGTTKLAISSTTTINAQSFVNSGNLTVDTNTLFVNAATNSVGIGTISPVQAFQVDSTTKGFLPPRMTTAQKNAISPQTPGMLVFDTTTNTLSVRSSSGWVTVGSGSFGFFEAAAITNPSDLRLKKNIKSLDLNVFDVLDKLNPVSFEWKNQFRENLGPQFGFVAQEVEKVLPNLVSTNDEGYKGVNEVAMIPILMEAIKKQQKQIAELTKEIQELKQK